jgi:Beta-propeller repeat
MFRRFQNLISAVTLTSLVFSFIVAGKENVQAKNGFETPGVSNPVQTNYGKTPLLFEINKGQTDRQAEFISRGAGYTLYLTKTEAVFSLKTNDAQSHDVLRMKLGGANKGATLEASDEAITKTNYYIGKKKFENVSNYRKVNYKKLYDGIDAVFYGNANNRLEYDFTVAPNADAAQIELTFDGAENVSIDDAGNLVLKTENTELVQQKPFAYQIIEGETHEIASRYVLSNKNTVKFELGEYDKSKTLIIDPTIDYLTYLGGSSLDLVDSIKVDAAGNAFVTGGTSSTNFPGPNSGSGNLDTAVYVSKISPDGQSVLYTTFLDGSKFDGVLEFFYGDTGNDIAIDAAGNAYISGVTESADFPTSSNAYQTDRYCNRYRGICEFPQEAFVAKLNPQGTVVYSTYLGGGKLDYANGIVIDSAGKAYVTGGTNSGLTFPKKNQFQTTGFFGTGDDAFITVFNADGSDIVYSSGFGGNIRDDANDIAIDAANNVYITGRTESDDTFPIKNGFQTTNGGGKDVFVAKFNTSLSGDASLIYSTLLGGGGTDEGFGIAVDDLNQAYITGITGSFDFPLQNAFRSTNQINEAFVSVISSTGNALVNSSFLGGSNQEEGRDITLGNAGVIYVTGNTLSPDFPKALPFQTAIAGNRDAFITKLKFGAGVMSSSFLGGNGFDSGEGIDVRGNHIFVIGVTGSNNLATTGGVLQPNPGATSNNTDGFVARILDTQIDSVGVFRGTSSFVITQSTTNIVAQTLPNTSGLAGQKAVSGDFDGDTITNTGTFTNGTWKVRSSNFPIASLVKTITFGASGDLAVVGDWNGDGIDTPGVFRPNTGQFILTDSTETAPSFNFNITRANFGVAGDLPIAGDWDGDGKDSIAVFRPSTGETFFTNDDVSVTTTLPVTQNPSIDFVAFIGLAGDLPIAGDWNGDGKDSLGVYRPSTTEFFLSDDNINLRPVFLFGQTGDQPLAGDWDGKPNP